MSTVSDQQASSSAGFSPEQQGYLRGFFEAALQVRPFVGQLSSGQLTHTPAPGLHNVAEPTFHGTAVSDLSAEELWKYEANPLDAWDDLLACAAENRAPSPEERFRFKFHGLFHVAPAQDSFMLRLRIPGGVLTSAQLRGLADLADQWGSGRLDLTTRGNVQIREFAPRHIVEVLKALRRIGLSSLGSGADNIRNITASPLSGYDPHELIDVQPFAEALENYILNSRDLFGLPRKFNIAFDNGGSISALADTNDIGFAAVYVGEGRSVPPGVYFRVLLCGITGHKQFASDCGLLLRPDQLVAVAAAMVRVFAEHGDRTNRKKARLKYLLDRWGVVRFLEETEKKLAFPVVRIDASECEPRMSVDRTAHLGVHRQSQPGRRYLGVAVPVGQLPSAQARALAHAAERFGSAEVRLTVWQNLLLPNIKAADVDAARSLLAEAGLTDTAGPVMSATVACTGSRGCRFAATDTKTHAVEIARALDTFFILNQPGSAQPINLHVTGCSHSCAQHYIGDIGLMGVKLNGEAAYQVNLGGGADTDRALARELFPAMPYTDVLPALHRLFTAYIERRLPAESFLHFTRRHTVEELRLLCREQAAQEVCA